MGRSEIIQIGDKRFTKQPAGEWKLVTAQATGDGWGSGSGVGSATGTKTDPPKINLECEYVGTSEIKGVLVDQYKKVRTITFSTPNGRRTRIVAKKYWFDKKGLLVREISDDDFAGATKSYRTVVEYEYDPTIKIEAPIN